MITSNGLRIFIDDTSSVVCYNFNVQTEEWEPYGAHYLRGALKNGVIVKSDQNVNIGYATNNSGTVVVSHNMGTNDIYIYKINAKTLIWQKIQTLSGIEPSTIESGSYDLDFSGEHIAICVKDHVGSVNDSKLYYYQYDSVIGLYIEKFTISDATNIANEKSIRSLVLNKDATRIFISDTNGNETDILTNTNGNGSVVIYDVDKTNYTYTLNSTLTPSNSAALFGYTISTNFTGDKVVISEPLEHKHYVYTYDDSTASWVIPTGYDLDALETSATRYNIVLSMNSLGDAFFVGESNGESGENGIIYGYYLDSSSNWQQYQSLSGEFFDVNDENNIDQISTDFSFTNTSDFGSVLSINAQGTTILTGSQSQSNTNKVVIVKDPKMASLNLSSIGLSPEEIIKLPLTPKELLNNSGLSTSELKQLGVSAATLIIGGETESNLYDNGYSLNEIFQATTDISGLINDSSNNLVSTDLLFISTVSDILNKGIDKDTLLNDLSELQSLNNIDLTQFKIANIDALELKNSAGVSALQLLQSAYNATELVNANFPVVDLKNAALSALDLKNAGLGITDLKDDYIAEELVQADFADADFQNIGYQVSETQQLNLQIGLVTINQSLKTYTQNTAISNLSSMTLTSNELTSFMQHNSYANDVFDITAYDSNGKNIFDVSQSNIVLSLDLPHLDPEEQNVIVKYDPDTYEIYDPQPFGYPVELTYNENTQLYSATLKQLSLLSTTFAASAPRTTEEFVNHEVYLTSAGKQVNGGYTQKRETTLYIMTTKDSKFLLSSTGINTSTNSYSTLYWQSPQDSSETLFRNCFDLTNCTIKSIKLLSASSDIQILAERLNVFNTIKRDTGHYQNETISNTHFCVKIVVQSIDSVQSGDLISLSTNDNLKLMNGIIAPNVTYSYYFQEAIEPVISGFNIPTTALYAYSPDLDTNEYYTNNKLSNQLLTVTLNTFLNTSPSPLDNIQTSNCVINQSESEINYDGTTQLNLSFSPVIDTDITTSKIEFVFPIGSLYSTTGTPNQTEYSFSYIYDAEPPTMEITSSNVSGFVSTSKYVSLTLSLSKLVRDFQQSYLNIENCKLEDLTQVDELTYTVLMITLSDYVDVRASVQLRANTITDLAGNTNTSASNIFYVNYDTTYPLLQISSDDVINGQSYNLPYIDFSVTSSEVIDPLSISDISLVNGGTLSRLSPTTQSDTYTLRLTPDDLLTSQEMEIYVMKNTVSDLNGNINKEDSPTFKWHYDVTKPVITVTSSVTSSSSSDDFVTYYIQSNREISEISLDSFEHSASCTLADLQPQSGKASGFFYQVKLFPLNNFDTNTFKVKANTIKDITNNYNEFDSSTFSWQYTGSTSSVSITSSDLVASQTVSKLDQNSISLNIKISDNSITLLDSDFTANYGTISNLTYDSNTYSYNCTYTSNTPYVTNEIYISRFKLIGTGGFGNNKSNVISWIWNKDPPSVVLSSSEVDHNGYSNKVEINILITPTETLQGFDIDDLVIVNGTFAGYNSSTNIVTIKPVPDVNDPDSAVNVSVVMPANKYTDAYNVSNIASNTFEWTYDTLKPVITITSSSMNSGETNNKYSINVSFTLNKIVSSFASNLITATNASLSDFTKTTDYVYNAILSYTPQSSSTVKSINLYVSEGSVVDQAGNENDKSNVFVWNSDRSPPMITSFYATSDGSVIPNNVGLQYTTSMLSSFYLNITFSKPVDNLSLSAFQTKDTYSIVQSNGEDVQVNTPFIVKSLVPSSGNTKYLALFGPSNIDNIESSYYTTGSVFLPVNSYRDKYGNVNQEQSTTYTLTHDNRVPELSFRATSIPDADGSYSIVESGTTTNDAKIKLYIESTSYLNNSGLDTSVLKAINAEITNYVKVNRALYEFEIIPLQSNTQVEIYLDGIFGKSSNNINLDAINPTTSFYWTSDTIRPNCILSSPLFVGLDENITNEQQIQVDLSFTEPPVSLSETDLTYVNCSFVTGTLSGSGNQYSIEVLSDAGVTTTDIISVEIPDSNTILDSAGNSVNAAYYNWKYNNITPKVSSIYADELNNDDYSSENIITINLQMSTAVFVESDKFVYSNCKLLSDFTESGDVPNLYIGRIVVSLKDSQAYKGLVKFTVPPSSFYDIVNHSTQRYNNESYTFQYNYINHIPKILITSSVQNNSTSNDSSIELFFKDEKNEPLYNFAIGDIDVDFNSDITATDVYIDPISFAQDGNSYKATLIANKDSDVIININPYSVSNINGDQNETFSTFYWTRDTSPVELSIFSDTLTSGQESDDLNLNIFIQSNKKIDINELKQNIELTNATIENLVDADSVNNPGTKFNTTLIPLRKNVQSSIKVISDSFQYIYDEYGNFNEADSNTFYWTFVGDNPTVSLTSPSFANGVISSEQDISFVVQITGDNVTLLESHINFTSGAGTLSNFVDYTDGSYSFDFNINESFKSTPISWFIPAGSFKDSFDVPNLASSTFVYTFDNSQPFVTITCDEVNNNTNSKFEQYHFDFTLSTSVTGFTLDDISHSGGRFLESALTKLGNVYSATYIPTITQGNMIIEVPGDVCVDPINNVGNSASQSPFIIGYDATSPVLEISGSVINGSSTSDGEITIDISFSKDIVDFDINDIFRSSNCNLILVPNTNQRFYQVRVSPTDSEYINFQILEDSFHDEFGNGNNESELFQWRSDSNGAFVSITSSLFAGKTLTNGSYRTAESSIPITIELSDDDNNLQLNVVDIELVNASIINNEIFSDITNPMKYTMFVTHDTPDETSSISVPEGVIFDSANNGNNASNVISWLYSIKLPEVYISSPTIQSGDTTNDESIVLYFDLTDTLVDGFSSAYLSLINCVVVDDEFSYIGATISGETTLYRYSCEIKYSTGGVYIGNAIANAENTATIQIQEGIIENKLNVGNNASPIFIWNYDNIAPTFTLESAVELDSIYYEYPELSMNMIVEGWGGGEASLNITTDNFVALNCSINNLTYVSDNLYTFDLQAINANEDCLVYMKSNQFTDEAGNTNSRSNIYTWVYDNSPLTVTSISATVGGKTFTNGGKTNDANLIIKAVFSEGILNFTSDNLISTNCIINSVIQPTSTTCEVNVTATSKYASIGGYTDKIINTSNYTQKYLSESATTLFSWEYDTTSPSFIINCDQQINNTLSNKEYLDISFVASRNVVGFVESTLDISGDVTISNFSGSGSAFGARFTPTPGSTQDIVIKLPSGSVFDEYGNPNNADVSFGWFFDSTPISVEISGNLPSGSIEENNAFIDLSFIFSENVKAFNLTNIQLTSGSLSVPTGDGAIYSATLRPSRPGVENKILIPSGSISDIVGNTNIEDISYVWTYQGSEVVPDLNSSDISNGDFYKQQSISININTGDAIVSDFNNTSYFEVTNGTISNISKVDDYNWSLTLNSTTANNPTSIYVKEQVLTDTNSNPNIQSGVFTWTYDNILPTVTITSPNINSGDLTNDSFIFLEFSISENASFTSSNDIIVTNGYIVNFEGSDKSYTAKLLPNNGFLSGEITVSVPSNTVYDIANNYNSSASNTFSWNYDKQPPTFIISSNEVQSNGSVGTEFVKLLVQASEDVTIDESAIICSNCALTSINNEINDLQNYEIIIRTSNWNADQNCKVYVQSGTVSDIAGNLNTTSSNIFAFKIKKEVTRIKDKSELYERFQSNSKIPEAVRDKLSENSIDIILGTSFANKYDNDANDRVNLENVLDENTDPYVFKTMIDQLFEQDNNSSYNKFKAKRDKLPFKDKTRQKLEETNKDSIVIAKSNQSLKIEDLVDDLGTEAIYVPLSEIDDYFEVDLSGADGSYKTFTITQTSEDIFKITDGNRYTDYFDATKDNDDTFTYFNFTIYFGSLTITYDDDSGNTNDPTEIPLLPGVAWIPCFLENTEILTTKGYVKVQHLKPGKHILIDDNHNRLKCLDVEGFVKTYDNIEFPYVVPKGSQLSSNWKCTKDLYLTYNHGIYLPHLNKYAPSSRLKLRQDKTKVEKYNYYHVFTSNFFCDTIIANGIPCETHSRYIKNTINTIDKSGLLMREILKYCKAEPDGTRNRMNKTEFNTLCKKYLKSKK